jgi:hypothetical protein
MIRATLLKSFETAALISVMSNFNPELNVQAYGDYWLYGGLGYIPEIETAKGDVF